MLVTSLFCLAGFIFILQVPALAYAAEPIWKRTIVVSQEEGRDNSTCWNETASESTPCKSLDYALEHVQNSTLVLLRPEKLAFNLSRHFNFKNLHDFALVGEESFSSLVNINCRNGSLSYESCGNIKLRGISIRGCGGLHPSTTGEAFGKFSHIQFLSAVFLVYCTNVVVNNFVISHSPGIGLNMYDVGGVVNISDSVFESNGPPTCTFPSFDFSAEDRAVAGGGVYVEFTYKGGTPPFIKGKSQFDRNNEYIFHNCTFENNFAPDQILFHTMIDYPHRDDHIPFGRGGGLSIFLKGNAENNTISISSCRFLNNCAMWGGGFFVEFQDKAQNNTFVIVNGRFKKNNASYAGGGIRSGFNVEGGNKQLIVNSMSYEGCVFEENMAILGAGISYYETSSLLKAERNGLDIVYKNCTWNSNKATMGSAIGLATQPAVNGFQDVTATKIELLYVVVFVDCDITNNEIILTEDGEVIGQGAVYSYAVPVTFQGNVRIENNKNTAMVVENVVIHVHGNLTFQYNEGYQGGALGLYGVSLLMLMPYSRLYFRHNCAAVRGGGIFIRDSGPPVVAFKTTELNTRQCFIAYNESFSLENVTQWQTKITFEGNKAPDGGGYSVYASSLQGCRRDGEHRINNKTLEWNGTIVYNDRSVSTGQQISTDPVLIRFNESEWDVSPSEIFNASISLIDEKNSSVLGVVKVIIKSPENFGNVKLGTASELFLVQPNSSKGLEGKINNLYLQGKVNSSFKIHLTTVAGRVVHASSKKSLVLKECNPGFEQTDGMKCSCLKNEAGIDHCQSDMKHVFLKAGYWGGTVGNKFITFPCPQHYCKLGNQSPFQYDVHDLCTEGRNGSSILCGECKANFSVNLGNEQCTPKCPNEYLWLLLLFFLVTLLLVLLVLRIDLDIFTTYLNTWLYSYQTVELLLQEGQKLDEFVSFIIGITNWRVTGTGTCLYKGMTNLQKLGVNYILPFYVLFLLFVLAKIARCRPVCYINRNVYRAFCTLLILCYTNITTISFNIIHYVPIKNRWVLFADGSIDFINNWREHLLFTVLAVCLILGFVILVPLLLLFTPWFLRYFRFLNNFRLYFDTFQQCFKVQYRWFAAYYFLCRIFILLIALYFPFGPLKRSILEVSSVLITVIFLYIQPYNVQFRCLNTLDAVLLTNLCFIVIFSSSIISDAPLAVQSGLKVTVNVLAYVPLVYLAVLIGYYGWRYFCPQNLDEYRDLPNQETNSMSETGHPGPI